MVLHVLRGYIGLISLELGAAKEWTNRWCAMRNGRKDSIVTQKYNEKMITFPKDSSKHCKAHMQMQAINNIYVLLINTNNILIKTGVYLFGMV